MTVGPGFYLVMPMTITDNRLFATIVEFSYRFEYTYGIFNVK